MIVKFCCKEYFFEIQKLFASDEIMRYHLMMLTKKFGNNEIK